MEQVVIDIFTAQELKDLHPGSFQSAYENWLHRWEYYWWSEVNEVISDFHERFGVKLELNIDYPSYSKVKQQNCVSRYFRPDLGYSEEVWPEDLCGQRMVAWLLEHHFHDIYEGKYYSTRGYYDENKKYHYRCRKSKVLFEPRILCGTWLGAAVMDPIHNAINDRRNVSDSWSLLDVYERCAVSLAECVRDDIESSQTEEAFLDQSEANDWKYTIGGSFYR